MLYLKFYFFIRKAKWEKRDSDTFFNKKKGITLTVYDRSDRRIINVITGENSSLEYSGLAWWLTKRFFKNINSRIKKQERKEERLQKRRDAQELKDKSEQRLISALNRECYVEIEYDGDARDEYKITEWLNEKEDYPFAKHTNGHRKAIYYFEYKKHATEFKMVWGGES